MTIAERNNKLKHFITCLKCEASGKPCDDNCSIQYEAGNMGEIIENLEAISKALEQEPLLDKIRADIEQLRNFKAENYDLEEYCDYFDARIIFRDDVLQIIDKYREVSE